MFPIDNRFDLRGGVLLRSHGDNHLGPRIRSWIPQNKPERLQVDIRSGEEKIQFGRCGQVQSTGIRKFPLTHVYRRATRSASCEIILRILAMSDMVPRDEGPRILVTILFLAVSPVGSDCFNPVDLYAVPAKAASVWSPSCRMRASLLDSQCWGFLAWTIRTVLRVTGGIKILATSKSKSGGVFGRPLLRGDGE